jgi:predicted acyltransferase
MAARLAWGRVFPIGKNLWTRPFALFSAGLAPRRWHCLARRRPGLAQLVAAARGVRTQSLAAYFHLGRVRQPAHVCG